MSCPKCGATSGDGWLQCEGSCPMPSSPYYSPHEAKMQRRAQERGSDDVIEVALIGDGLIRKVKI